MTYVDWFNHRPLHGEITNDASYTTPAEAEATHYRQAQPAEEAITQLPEQSSTRGDSDVEIYGPDWGHDSPSSIIHYAIPRELEGATP